MKDISSNQLFIQKPLLSRTFDKSLREFNVFYVRITTRLPFTETVVLP